MILLWGKIIQFLNLRGRINLLTLRQTLVKSSDSYTPKSKKEYCM